MSIKVSTLRLPESMAKGQTGSAGSQIRMQDVSESFGLDVSRCRAKYRSGGEPLEVFWL
jgi:hypothetical protein